MMGDRTNGALQVGPEAVQVLGTGTQQTELCT
jgi:hypothetical protein